MEVIFNPYLSSSLFFRPEQMYGENRKIFEELPHIDQGNVYFLAERRKVRVLPSSISLSQGGYISVSFILEDGSSIPASFPFATTIINLGPSFLRIYGDADTLQKYVVGVKNQDEYLAKSKSSTDRPWIGVSLNSEAQNKKNIALRLHTPDGRVSPLQFSVHSILSEFGINIGDYPRVLYIGKSEHLTDRIYRHEKIQHALSTIDDDSDLYLYAFQFDTNKYTISYPENQPMLLKRDFVTDISAKDQLAIVEMCLINYFKPELNRDYKECDIPVNDVYQKALKGRYNKVILEVDHDGGFWNFGTEHISAKLRHQIEYLV